jgi:glutamyl-tRNA synthetase
MARAAAGRVILRIEDIDSSRVRPGMAELAMADLRWLGLDWDEGPDVGGGSGPYVQSARLDHYEKALDRLKRLELVYPCTCTRAEIQRMASAPHAGEEGPIYPGTCAGRSARDGARLAGCRFSWRFRVEPGEVSWDDLFKGPIALDPSQMVGDFVVGRSEGGPSYQLAVVVDDAEMGVTQVIRGDDLVSSTPRQMLLYRALGYDHPRFGHVPLVIGPDGRRLAKRDDSIKLAMLREQGIDPRWLVGRIGETIGLGYGGPARPSDWVGRFAPASVPRGMVVLDPGARESSFPG